MYKAPPIAALIGSVYLTFPFKCSARSRRTARTFAATLKPRTHSPRVSYTGLPPPRDRTKRAKQGRRDARRPRGATSRRVGLSGFSISLSPATDALTSRSQEGQLLPPPLSPCYHHLWQRTLPPLPRRRFFSPPVLARSHERFVPTSARILGWPRVLTSVHRARTRGHESTAYAHVWREPRQAMSGRWKCW